MLLLSDCTVLGSGAFLADNCFNDKCGNSRTKISKGSLKGKSLSYDWDKLNLFGGGEEKGELDLSRAQEDKNKLGTFGTGRVWSPAGGH